MSKEKSHKVLSSLIKHVYMQTPVGMLASIFCACIIFIGLHNSHTQNTQLYLWSTVFLIITLLRLIMAIRYRFVKYPEKNIRFWRNFYILGSILGGFSWGWIGIFLLPAANPVQQTLIILMLAGVTAGAVPLSSAIPQALISFLIFSIFPFIISIALFKNSTYILFDMALTIYLLYTIVLSVKSYKLIKSSIILKYDNDILLHNLELINKKLEHAATHDPLTQVSNRTLFRANLEKAIESAKENKNLLALFFIDLDDFKSANDKFGHQAGDHILVIIVDRLKQFFHQDDVIARLGGDEIAIIVENVHNQFEIEEIARKVCHLIAIPIEINNTSVTISASIGIGIYPYDGMDESSLIQSSDKACIMQKNLVEIIFISVESLLNKI